MKSFALTHTEGVKELKPMLKNLKSNSPEIQIISTGIKVLVCFYCFATYTCVIPTNLF